LGDLEHCLTDLIAIADADFVVGESVDGEILTEVTGPSVVARQLRCPVAVRVELVSTLSRLTIGRPETRCFQTP
jgi:hypothetical protein